MSEKRYEYYLMLANHWSYTGIGWPLGLESCRNSIEDSLNTADVYPHVKVCINLDARAYEAVKKYFPETIERLKKYLKEGKTEIIGGTYGQPMGSMIGNESVIRQLTEGRKVVEKVLDFDMPSFLEEEEFTFPQLPQLLLQSGFRYASLAQCDTWGKVGAPVMDHSRIRWEGKDGSCIPALPRTKLYFHPPCVTSDVQELLTDKMRGNIRELTENGEPPIVTVWTEFGWEPIGEHNINKFYVENYQALAERDDVHFVTLGEYLSRHALPTDKKVYVAYDDLKKLLPWGIGADQLRRYDRVIENLLLAAERLDAVLYLLGEKSNGRKITQAWKNLMISQSHDVSLCEYTRWGGGVIPQEDPVENYYGMQWGAIGYRYLDEAFQSAKKQVAELSGRLANETDTTTGQNALRVFTVFNPTETPLKAAVKTEKLFLKGRERKVAHFCLKNRRGKTIPLQGEEEKKDPSGCRVRMQFLWETDEIAPMGYETYYLCEGENVPASDNRILTETGGCFLLENECIRAQIDKKSGKLTQLVCKETGETVLCDSFRFHGEPSKIYPEWAKSANLPYQDSDLAEVKVRVKQDGAVRATIESELTSGQFVFMIDYTLDSRAAGLEVRCRLKIHVPPKAADGKINGWQLPLDIPDGYWLDFGLADKDARFVLDAPFEVTSTEKDAFHALTFLDVVGEKTSVMIVNGGNQYFKKTENGVSNLLMREWESHFTAQCDWPTYSGYSYLLIPHKSGCSDAERVRMGRSKDEKLIVSETGVHAGRLQTSGSFLEMERNSTLLSSFRVVDDSLEVRLFNCSGEQEKTEIRLPKPFKTVEITDFMHRNRQKIAENGDSFCAELKGWQVCTYRVSFK